MCGLKSICLPRFIYQWEFQDPKMEVPTIYKAYVREYHHKIWPYMVQYLHFRILKFPLIYIYISLSLSFMVSLHVSNTAISGLRPKALGAAAGEHHDECQGADAPAL